MSKPAHKQDDPTYAPGQIVNRPEQTLGDYLARKNYHEAFDKVAEEKGLKKKKLTFDAWWTDYMHWQFSPDIGDNPEVKYRFAQCWKAAQENV